MRDSRRLSASRPSAKIANFNILIICVAPLRRCFAAHGSVTKMELEMQKKWTLEMHHPGDAGDSLITTDRFDGVSGPGTSDFKYLSWATASSLKPRTCGQTAQPPDQLIAMLAGKGIERPDWRSVRDVMRPSREPKRTPCTRVRATSLRCPPHCAACPRPFRRTRQYLQERRSCLLPFDSAG
jgi:hypothetical protein